MEVKTVKEITITLTMEEARILKDLTQNPMCEPDLEPHEVTVFRVNVWNVLKDIR